MAHRSYREESRSNWGCTDRAPGLDELKLGALMYERWWRESSAGVKRLERRNAALRGQITKLRKRLAEE